MTASVGEDNKYLTLNDIRRMARRPVRAVNEWTHDFFDDNNSDTSATSGEQSQQLEKILAVRRHDQRIQHLVKLRGSNKCHLFDNDYMNRHFPEEVIRFYQKQLIFH